MIANCKGCQEELKEIIEYSEQGLYFAGSGFKEKGHIIMTMVDDKGRIVVE